MWRRIKISQLILGNNADEVILKILVLKSVKSKKKNNASNNSNASTNASNATIQNKGEVRDKNKFSSN